MKKIFFFLVITALIACSPSTQIVKSWHEPGATILPSPDHKLLVIGMVKDESSRRIIEDNLVKRIKATSVPSYTLLATEIIKADKQDAVSAQISQGGFTHVVMIRLADVEKETSYVPGTTTGFYGGWGRYYGYGAGFYGTPGYYTTDKNYFVETAVYSVNPDKLLWTGTTKTVNPSKIEKTINEIADAVTLQMQKDGFLPIAEKK